MKLKPLEKQQWGLVSHPKCNVLPEATASPLIIMDSLWPGQRVTSLSCDLLRSTPTSSLVLLLLMVWWPVRRCSWESIEVTKSAQISPDPHTHTHSSTAVCWPVSGEEAPVSVSHLIFIRPPSRDPESSRPVAQRALPLTTSAVTEVGALDAQVDGVCVTWWLLAQRALLPTGLTVSRHI